MDGLEFNSIRIYENFVEDYAEQQSRRISEGFFEPRVSHSQISQPVFRSVRQNQNQTRDLPAPKLAAATKPRPRSNVLLLTG